MSGTSVVLQIVGNVVGGYFFGPVGAAVGGAVGNVAGNLLDPNDARGPQINDLKVRSSTYGRTIPLIYARENRVGGNIIWSGGLVETAHTSGATWSGDKVTTYTYSTSCAIAIGQGEMRNLEAVYANGKLIFSRAKTIEKNLGQYLRAAEAANALCMVGPNANPAQCAITADNLNFLQNHTQPLLPDFTPWVVTNHVTLDSDGQGEAYGKAAALVATGLFSALEWFPGTSDQPASAVIPAPTPAYRNTAYLVFKNLQLAGFGNQLPTIEVVVSGRREETVASILDDFASRAGADIDEIVPRAALASMFVRGYAIGTAGNAVAAVQPLMKVFPFDACDQNGVLRFTPRSRGPVATIEMGEMGARTPDDSRQIVFPVERMPNYKMPSEASISYVDPDNAYQVSTQIATRAAGDAQTKLNDSVPITLSADEARALADRTLWEGWLSREQVREVKLSARHDFLQAGDPFAVPTIEGSVLYRVLSLERGDNQILNLALLREDRLAYEGTQPAGDGFTFDQDELSVGETIPFLFNAPILQSSDDNTGFYYALDSDSPGWDFGDLSRSVDNGATWERAAHSNLRQLTGTLDAPLASGPTETWDRLNQIVVAFTDPEATPPDSVDEDALLASPINMVWVGAPDGSDGELIQFATVTPYSDGYILSDLLRGRRGTEHAVGIHAPGDSVIFVSQTGVGSLDYGQADWNLQRLYVGTNPVQLPTDKPIFTAFISTGERLRPRAPMHGAGARDGSNNLMLTWVRRTRLFPPPMGYGPAPLGEVSESYEVDVMDGITVLRTIATTTPTASYSAAQQTADGLTPGDPVTVRVYQISATYGRGWPGEFTI